MAMKAAVLERYGAPEEFKIKDITIPEIKGGQILVSNKASSVNPVDTLVRKGSFRLVTGITGNVITGCDFCGRVIESKSSRFKAGDDVFGFFSAVKGGAYAGVIAADDSNAAIKPGNLSYVEAASLPLVGLTAWQGLVKDGQLAHGDKVLIMGCTGGVGTAAVQIAKSFNAVVTGTCSEKNTGFARTIGCDRVINYEKEQVPREEKFDLIFDASGNFSISDMKDNLTDRAMFVSTRGGTHDAGGVIQAAIDIVFRKRMKIVMVKPDAKDLETLKELIETEKLKPCIAHTFPLEQLPEAHRMLEKGGFTGKIAIEI